MTTEKLALDVPVVPMEHLFTMEGSRVPLGGRLEIPLLGIPRQMIPQFWTMYSSSKVEGGRLPLVFTYERAI